MLTGLVLSAFLMGLAGVPHCVVMCAAPCAAARSQGLTWPVVAGRSAGYAALGALAAVATSALAAWSAWAVQLQPLWVMGLAATICLGCWMLAYGRVPPLLMALPSGSARQWPLGVSMLSGMAWAALPCGLLYSAIVAAALAPNALQGATVMLAFSLPGGLMLKWLPTYWRRSLHASRHAWVRQWASPQWAIRLSGGTLAMAAGWAISHRLMAQWQAWCA